MLLNIASVNISVFLSKRFSKLKLKSTIITHLFLVLRHFVAKVKNLDCSNISIFVVIVGFILGPGRLSS